MKKTIESIRSQFLLSLSALFFLGLGNLAAQVPQGINYQAVVRDGGSLLTNQIVDIRFTLLSGGIEMYQESQNLTTDERGLVQTVIGQGVSLIGSMDSIPWESGDVSLKVALDAGGGFSNLGTTPLESVPFSLYAQQVADISSHSLSELADVGPDSAETGEVLQWDGQNWTPGTVDVPQIWAENGSQITYSGSAVGIRTTTPTSTLTVRGNQDLVDFSSNARKMRLFGTSHGAIDITGAAGSRNAIITNTAGSLDYGFMGIYNESSQLRAYMEIANNIGRIVTRGPNDARNTSLTWLGGCNDCGYIGVYDANSLEAGMYVNTSGQGVVFGDIKNFRMEHPTQAGKEIWYASLEGPEAGAYDRGTAQLVNGKAKVELSDHFAMVAANEGLTVVLTPMSGASKGLAVMNKSNTGFEVVELFEGQGNYEFDWEIKAVRQGFEDYRVIRDAEESRPGGPIEEEREHEKNPAGEPVNEK